MSWIPLHVHSQYSVLNATASVAQLAEKATRLGLPALALTDYDMYGAVDFFKACKQAKVKPIIGCELYVAPFSRLDKKRFPGFPHGYPVVLLAKNREGYKNLCKLSSLAHLEGFYYTPRIDKELLAQHREGLICLSGSLSAVIPQLIVQDKEQELQEEIRWYQALFGEDYYFELQRHCMSEADIRADRMESEPWIFQNHLDHVRQQEKVIAKLRELSVQQQIKCVATNNIHYLERDDWKAHEILMNIQSGEPCEIWEKDSYGNLKTRVPNPKRQTLFSHELYFKTPEQMGQLFSDCPGALETTLHIAEQCDFEFDFKSRYYPVFVPPHLENVALKKEERRKEVSEFLRQLCEQGLKKRYQEQQLQKVGEKYPGRDPLTVVRERLEYELEIIISKDMCDYLLIVYDFITWAKSQGIPMGPGRGSGAGSIILYLIEITDIEPLRFNLFFERFINPERLSYPDIDVDICMERRAEVIDYTLKKYGKERVAQIITFGTMKAKMAIKDVGRVLSVPLAKVNAIAKLVPEELNITIEKALETDRDLRTQYETDEEVRTLIDIAQKLEGSVRNTGIHAAGIIISGDPIIEHIPVCASKDSEMVATQFSMKPVESVGMLKIDFLGLKTLTSIQRAADAVKNRESQPFDWVNLPLNDQKTFDLLNQGKTLGIFQVESGGMQDLLKQLRVDKFEEIIAVGALYRPGPMEMIPSFISRKHGREALEIDHPLMYDILAETYGIMVYQEQVMQIASLLAGYSLGEGDVLRRAMGKKDKEEMSKQREKFRLGALAKGVEEKTALLIFDKVEKFASYGFNKSHAAAYGYLTYVTAYMKANYPGEWMAALLTSDRDDVSKVARIIRECQAMDIPILPPDINESGNQFIATPRGIRFAMTAIRGIGEGVVEAIVDQRNAQGPFKSLHDFFKRIDTRKIGKKMIETLINAGCFDFTGWSHEQMLGSVDPLFSQAVREQKETALGIVDLFSLLGEEEEYQPPSVKETIPKQLLLKKEKELLGFYLNGHPLDDFREIIEKFSTTSLEGLSDQAEGVYRVVCIIEAVQVKVTSKTQKKFAILTISDKEATENLELLVWPELYDEKNHLLVENRLIGAVISLEKPMGELKLQARWLEDLTQVTGDKIKEAEAIYDRAKKQVKMSTKPVPKSQAAVQEVSASQCLLLQFDIEAMRLSHVLKLKEIFRSFPGKVPVRIEFFADQTKVGSLAIDRTWGVQLETSFEEKLRQFKALKNLRILV